MVMPPLAVTLRFELLSAPTGKTSIIIADKAERQFWRSFIYDKRASVYVVSRKQNS
jgi:hypothetical protein